MKRFSRTALPAAAMAMALGGCMAGTTYGTGVSPGKQTVDDIVGIVSLGNNTSKPPIDYKPRPPIVAPPKAAALPPPEDPKPATAANWPTDPDQKSTTASGDVYIPVAGNKSAFADDGKDLGERAYEDHLRFGKQKQKVYADAKAAAAGTFDANGNPIRRTLSEPPSSYRVPDPEAPEEFTAPTKKKWWQFGK